MSDDRYREAVLRALGDPQPLLRPRLAPPVLPGSTVPRLEIRARLEAAEDRCATLLRAPAGFGKTIAAADWAHWRTKPTAWLSLERSDNEPDEFLRYLLGAFAHAGIPSDLQTAADILGSSDRAGPDALLLKFMNELVDEPARRVLVLEHYEYIENPAVHRLVEFLLNQLQSTLRLVFISRIEPPIDIPRLRACGLLSEIRTSVFQFSDKELQELFELEAQVDLTSQEVKFLQNKLLGWAAGLQSVAHELRFQPGEPGVRSAYERALPSLETFALTQFLDHCDPHDVRILERMAELDRIDPAAATIFAPELSGRDFMWELLEAGVPLKVRRAGTPGHSYSLHPVLQQALRRKLREESAAKLPALHRRAAAHYEGRGESSRAAAHLLRAAVEERALGERQAALDLVKEALETGLEANLRPTSMATMVPASDLIRSWAERAGSAVDEQERPLLKYAGQIVEFLNKDEAGEDKLAWSPDALSERELEVMDLLADGRTSAAIADDLILSPHTVRTHVKNIYRKLRVHSRVEAIDRARELGLLH